VENFKVTIRANQRIESAINSFRRKVKGSEVLDIYKNKHRFMTKAERAKVKAARRRKQMGSTTEVEE
jgi:ribosomal protein S21